MATKKQTAETPQGRMTVIDSPPQILLSHTILEEISLLMDGEVTVMLMTRV